MYRVSRTLRILYENHSKSHTPQQDFFPGFFEICFDWEGVENSFFDIIGNIENVMLVLQAN